MEQIEIKYEAGEKRSANAAASLKTKVLPFPARSDLSNKAVDHETESSPDSAHPHDQNDSEGLANPKIYQSEGSLTDQPPSKSRVYASIKMVLKDLCDGLVVIGKAVEWLLRQVETIVSLIIKLIKEAVLPLIAVLERILAAALAGLLTFFLINLAEMREEAATLTAEEVKARTWGEWFAKAAEKTDQNEMLFILLSGLVAALTGLRITRWFKRSPSGDNNTKSENKS